MTDALLAGGLLGLVLATLIGPVFFLLIDTSIKKGFREAVWLAAGVLLSDAFYIAITYFSSTALSFMKTYGREIGCCGGLLLMGFGLTNMLKKPRISATALELPAATVHPSADLAKGFMMNVLNPFVLLFWMGVAGGITARDAWTADQTLVFYAAALITVLGTDLLKAWLAVRLKKVLRPGVLHNINRLSGAGLFIFGLRILYLALFGDKF